MGLVMSELIYRDEQFSFSVKSVAGRQVEVTIHGRPYNTSTTVRRKGVHPELRLSFDELSQILAEHGEGPHAHVVKRVVGSTKVIHQPKKSGRQSR